MALAAELLCLGADPGARERDPHGSDNEDDDPWTSRLYSDDGSLRTTLELLALNHYAEPEAVSSAVARAVALKADPNHGRFGEKPLLLAVRSQHVAAAKALLQGGAQITRQVLVALRSVSCERKRHDLEDSFLKQRCQTGGVNLTLQDVGLWAAVQCGFKGVAVKAIEDGAQVDTGVFVALRRCRLEDSRRTVEIALRNRMGPAEFEDLRAEAATCELAVELREALLNQRDPDATLVDKLLALGANPHQRGVDLDDLDMDVSDDSDDEQSGNSDRSRSRSNSGSSSSSSS